MTDRRERTPRCIPVGERQSGPVIKLDVERKHLTSVLKIVAYHADGLCFSSATPLQ